MWSQLRTLQRNTSVQTTVDSCSRAYQLAITNFWTKTQISFWNHQDRIFSFLVVNISPFRHSAIPPFRYSIIPSNGVTLLNSTHYSLRRYSRSFEHFSPIEMVKWSLFESMKFVFKVSSICRSNLFRHFCKGEVFFSITCMRRHYEIILRCLSSIVVSRLELKKLYLWIYWK